MMMIISAEENAVGSTRSTTWIKASTLIVGGLIFARLFSISIHPSLWWMGFLLWTLLLHLWAIDCMRPLALARRLGRNRIDLNLHAAAHHPTGWARFTWYTLRWPPFYYRFIILLTPLALLFSMPLIQEIQNWSLRLRIATTPRSLFLRAEPPAFAAPEVTELKILSGQVEKTSIVAASVVDLRLVGGAGWKALFEPLESVSRSSTSSLAHMRVTANTPQGAEVEFKSELSSAGTWSGSTDRLLEELGLNKKENQTLSLEIIEDSNKPFQAILEILPAPVPQVILERTAASPEQSASPDGDQGELFFSVSARSETPLTQVELLVRTRSGYRFTMPVGEFAGTDRLEFSAASIRLATIGIPFEPEDELIVQARARTFVKGLEGLSKELKFPVRGPSEVRQELINQLEQILSNLQNHKQGSEAFQSWKNDLGQQLDKAAQTAKDLGRQSQPARAVEQARSLASRLTDDSAGSRKPIESRIQDAIEGLKRSQAEEKASSWFMKTRSHLDDLAQSDLTQDKVRLEKSAAANDLADASEELKSKLAEVVNSPSSGLTLEEKQSALDLLARDQTPEGMSAHAESVELGEKDAALQEGRATLEAATNNLGRILQLVGIARARRIREAREKLQNADTSLEEARQAQNQAAQQQETNNAQKQLDGTPQLGEVFDDALSQAQEATRGAGQALQSGKQGQFKERLDEAQQAIGEALSALQDEERSLREERSEEEGRRFRSAMDAMNAQGQLDSGWRKKIFEEISRLREEGIPADADIIRYLESRLR